MFVFFAVVCLCLSDSSFYFYFFLHLAVWFWSRFLSTVPIGSLFLPLLHHARSEGFFFLFSVEKVVWDTWISNSCLVSSIPFYDEKKNMSSHYLCNFNVVLSSLSFVSATISVINSVQLRGRMLVNVATDKYIIYNKKNPSKLLILNEKKNEDGINEWDAHTCMADLLGDICSDVREIPHGQEAVKTWALLCFLDGEVEERQTLTISSDYVHCKVNGRTEPVSDIGLPVHMAYRWRCSGEQWPQGTSLCRWWSPATIISEFISPLHLRSQKITLISLVFNSLSENGQV